jgi:hypothetical protein
MLDPLGKEDYAFQTVQAIPRMVSLIAVIVDRSHYTNYPQANEFSSGSLV